MKRKRDTLLFISFIIPVFFLSCTTISEQRGLYDVKFTWFLSYHSCQSPVKFLHPGNPRLVLKKGDHVTLSFEHICESTNLYIFHFEPDGTFHSIYPGNVGNSLLKKIKEITFEWKITGPPGTEKLYIIGSRDKLGSIENLVAAIEKEDEGENYKNKIHLLYEQVETLFIQTSSLLAPAENIVRFSGVYRGKEPLLKTRVQAETLYVKKIRVSH